MTRAALKIVERHEPAEPVAFPRAVPMSPRRAMMDDQKRSFLRMVSHELRTPLNAVIGFSEMLACELYGPLGAPQYKEYAEHIRESGHRLLTLVNQILELARLEGHGIDMEVCAEPLDHALEDVLEQLAPDLKATGVCIDISDDTALQQVFAESRGLRTMLFNLLQNAVKWSPERGRVRVDATRDGGMVRIAISDQGAGVEPEDLDRILRPFEQGQCALTRTASGAGLGLPIVQALSRAMNGDLALTSEPGAGFTATLSLPAA
ncbi:MAG: HAMP domain-containing histidine kinase [Caulobacter sp.]|nr:HAMP domain-containing histidine kinase [Caulobacter sp.]